MDRQRTASRPWSLQPEKIFESMGVGDQSGLRGSAVLEQRRRFGSNALAHTRPRAAVLIFFAQFRSLIVLLLAAAAATSFAFHDWLEGSAILTVILINALLGFMTEFGAVRSMESLRRLIQVNVRVRRGGELKQVPASELVPGDVVVVEGGDVIAADMRLITASRLLADESSLTGESVPVDKAIDVLPGETPLADRANMLHNGTSITRGAGEAVVTATGMATELGQISHLVASAEDETTPLEKRLNQLALMLVWVTLLIVVLTALAGIRAGKGAYLMIETAIALAVAAIPEGLPIVATMALARGMWRMARRHALINRLAAVETLGATSVICTDKTGTLTENRMTVVRLVLAGGVDVAMDALPDKLPPVLEDAFETAALCNNASYEGVGDPLEVALLVAAAEAGVVPGDQTRVGEEAFDSDTKMMATIHQDGEVLICHVKGAAEAIIEACRDLSVEEKQGWLRRNESLAEDGLRVLALARKQVMDATACPYSELQFLGLVGMVDPPKADVKAAIAACRSAGIRVIMITGDQPATAAYVANAIGLSENLDKSDVVTGAEMEAQPGFDRERLCEFPAFARVSPKQKLEIIDSHQKSHHVVAMTGDGINDAPALKEADIGIAMGVRGTEVAKEAADMVLEDDAFGTIVAAVAHGRTIFANIRRFVVYLMSCNLSEILIVSLAAAVNAPLPILPLQILFLNMVTDVFPALALGMGEGQRDSLSQPPRDVGEPIVRRRDWYSICAFSGLISASVLVVFVLALRWLEFDTAEAVSIAFVTLALAQLFHVFNMRAPGEGMLRNQITRNVFVWVALLLCFVLLAVALFVPPIAHILALQPPSVSGWKLIVAGAITPLVVGQLAMAIRDRRIPKLH